MEPNFCIITTTYKRPELILRCLDSSLKQTFRNWEHLIVVDDKESDYSALLSFSKSDPRFTILNNETNIGKNASINLAFKHLQNKQFSGYIIFLDDDDWLSPSCLLDFATNIARNPYKWLVSNRTNTDSIPFTQNKTGGNLIHYQRNCLLKKNFAGDATHCIDFSIIKNIQMPLSIKNAEEWLFFAQLSTRNPYFKYLPVNGTISEGYANSGLTDLYHKNKEADKNAYKLLKEVVSRKIYSPIILGYTLTRFFRSLV